MANNKQTELFMKLTAEQTEALDLLLGYVIQSEEADYYERLDEGDSVEGHVYKFAMTLSEAFNSEASDSNQRIVVLNDGETYTDIDGCRILTLTPEGSEKLEQGLDPRYLTSEDISYTEWLRAN